MTEIHKRWSRWDRGSFSVMLDSGSTFWFRGGLRLQRDENGYIIDVDTDADAVVMFPSMHRIVAITKVSK